MDIEGIMEESVGKKLSDNKISIILTLLDEYLIKRPDQRSYLFVSIEFISFKFMALLYSIHVMDKYEHLFNKTLVDRYALLDELDIYSTDMIECLNIYNLDKYYNKFYNSVLPNIQATLCDSSISELSVDENVDGSCGMSLTYMKKGRLYSLNLQYLHNFRILYDLSILIANANANGDYRDHIKYIIDHKVIVPCINIDYFNISNIETMYYYSVEQGFDIDNFHLISYPCHEPLEYIKNLLIHSSNVSVEFYLFVVKLIIKEYTQIPDELVDYTNLISLKKVA